MERAVDITMQAALALDAAHANGLVHRDVKPANLLIDAGNGADRPDHVYLSDFGLSKWSLPDPELAVGQLNALRSAAKAAPGVERAAGDLQLRQHLGDRQQAGRSPSSVCCLLRRDWACAFPMRARWSCVLLMGVLVVLIKPRLAWITQAAYMCQSTIATSLLCQPVDARCAQGNIAR